MNHAGGLSLVLKTLIKLGFLVMLLLGWILTSHAGFYFSDKDKHHHPQGMPEHTVSIPGVAAETECSNLIGVDVLGFDCRICAQMLTQAFGLRTEVAGVDVNLKQGFITIATKAGQAIDESTINQIILDHGYKVKAIKKGC
jgi:hypothetical protein